MIAGETILLLDTEDRTITMDRKNGTIAIRGIPNRAESRERE